MSSVLSAPGSENLVGAVLDGDRYEVEDVLGHGSMGFVYLARDARLDTQVVVKVPTLQRLADEEFRERFLRESQFLVKLSHPAIVKVVDAGEFTHEEGHVTPYFVMQHIDGGSLRSRMRDENGRLRAMRPHTLTRWLPQVADALDFMHDRACIHRDIKPANILFDKSKHPYLSDFGLSKLQDGTVDHHDATSDLTGAGAIVGTPNYVAPEIVLGQDYTGKADQYSLACTVYEVLAGRPPLEGPSASATMVNQTTKKAPLLSDKNPRIPRRLALVVNKALSKNPAGRFISCKEFADNVLESLAEPAASPSSASSVPATSNSTLIAAAPQYVVAGVSRIRNGEGKCPACENPIKPQPMHAGKKGRCVKCGIKLLITPDLLQVKHLKLSPIAKARGGPSESAINREFSLEIGQKVFGWKISQRTAAILAGVLMLTIIVFGGLFAKRAAEMDDRPEAANKVLQEDRAEAAARKQSEERALRDQAALPSLNREGG